MSIKNRYCRKCEVKKPLDHVWKFDGLSLHNGEYWYKCKKCGKSDWITGWDDIDGLDAGNCPGKKK